MYAWSGREPASQGRSPPFAPEPHEQVIDLEAGLAVRLLKDGAKLTLVYQKNGQYVAVECANPADLPQGLGFVIQKIDFYTRRKEIDDAYVKTLDRLTSLQGINLSGCQVTDAGLVHLAKHHPGLLWLYLYNALGVTDAGLRHVARLSGLQVIHVDGTKISDAGLEPLKERKELRELNLKRTNVSTVGVWVLMAELPKCLIEHDKLLPPTVREVAQWVLKNGGTLRLALPDKDADCNRIEDLPTGRFVIRVIHFWQQDHIQDAHLGMLSSLTTRLQGLSLGGTSVSDSGLEVIKKQHPFMTWLYLSRLQITDTGLIHVGELLQLENLDLAHTRITDKGLVHLKGLTRLRGLDLTGTGVTDAGLEHLKSLNGLVKLVLKGTKISDRGVQQLRTALTGCKIEN